MKPIKWRRDGDFYYFGSTHLFVAKFGSMKLYTGGIAGEPIVLEAKSLKAAKKEALTKACELLSEKIELFKQGLAES